MSPWYIDPERLTTFVPTKREESIIDEFKNSNLVENLENSRNIVINRFVENGPSMIDEINSFNPSLVVDLACGIHPYKNAIKNIVGIDITETQDVNYICSFCNTPFKDNVADVILCLNGYAFKERNKEVFSEIKRIAKNGARVYCRAGNKAFLTSNIHGPDYINAVTEEYGFAFFHDLKNASYTSREDKGIYFKKDGNHPIESKMRMRWVWTWLVNK